MSDQYSSESLAGAGEAREIQTPVGQVLKAAREARGLDIADLAQALKLGPRQVEALENGDWQGLPGNTFIRGFVRNYARAVQVEPAPLMAQLDQILAKPASMLIEQEAHPAEMPRVAERGSRSDRAVIVVSAGLVVLSCLIYFLLPNDLTSVKQSVESLIGSFGQSAGPSAETPKALVPTQPEPVFPPGATPQQIMNPQAVMPPESPPGAGTTGAKAESSALVPPPTLTPGVAETQAVVKPPQLRFVFDKDSWLEVRDRDGKQIFSQKLTAGTEQTLAGQGPFSLVIGYAPGVRVFWHGQSIDLAPHSRGDVARFVLE